MFFFNLFAMISLVVCDGGPGDHFATFTEKFVEKGHEVQICASNNAIKKFQNRSITVQKSFSLDGLSEKEQDALAEEIARSCSAAEIVLTDVGNAFDVKVQKAFQRIAQKIKRYAYYDNPESFVPGGYSSVAAEVMQLAEKVLFANAHLAKGDLYSAPETTIAIAAEKRLGIGYYPLQSAESVARRRASEEKKNLRAQLFQGIEKADQGQKILVYFGGNNEVYYSKAFPAFIEILASAEKKQDLSDYLIVMQQHPGAKAKNLDREYLHTKLKSLQSGIAISPFSTEDILVIADGAMYYQTSMGPQFILAGVPVLQIGHECFRDILIKNHLCPSVTEDQSFLDGLNSLESLAQKTAEREAIYLGLGIDLQWEKKLLSCFE